MYNTKKGYLFLIEGHFECTDKNCRRVILDCEKNKYAQKISSTVCFGLYSMKLIILTEY